MVVRRRSVAIAATPSARFVTISGSDDAVNLVGLVRAAELPLPVLDYPETGHIILNAHVYEGALSV